MIREGARWPASRVARLVRGAALVLSCAALIWTLVLLVRGGFDLTFLGLRIRSNNPLRVAGVAAVAFTIFLAAGGSIRAPLMTLASACWGWTVTVSRRHGWIAGGLAVLATITALAYGTRVAGGSDAYGYVSEADLWLDGQLRQEVPWIDVAPWPGKEWIFCPPGYKPVQTNGHWTIVPTYSAGLPLLMAGAKRVGGQCALFAVVPVLSGLAVLATYGLGRRLGSSRAGLVAAWLVATSPAVLGHMMEPLTDVPVMSAWALAFFFLLGKSAASAWAAGLFAAAAILIRPNLFVLAGIMAAWFFVRRAGGARGSRSRWMRAVAFAAGVLPGVVGVAAINQHLYGSPAMSGYGSLGAQFAWARILPNLERYLSWYAASQTPLAWLGMFAIAVPMRRLWPTVPDRSVFAIIGAYVAALWLEYAAYLEFDSWGFLRFLLPSWPFLMLGLSAVLLSLAPHGRRVRTWIATAAAFALGVWTIGFAERHGVFDQRQAARHEAVLGPLVRARTEPSSVVIALARAGSLRYYSGRMTARYDYIEADWLDRFVAWMSAHGIHVYALLDEREIEECKLRFRGQHTLARLEVPAMDYRPGSTRLFDLAPASSESTATTTVIMEVPPALSGCDPPAPRPRPAQ